MLDRSIYEKDAKASLGKKYEPFLAWRNGKAKPVFDKIDEALDALSDEQKNGSHEYTATKLMLMSTGNIIPWKRDYTEMYQQLDQIIEEGEKHNGRK